jgi:autophagy-related protein 11
LLTSLGKQVRTQTLLNETELFVFDSSRLNSKSGLSSNDLASAPSDFNPGTPPDAPSSNNDLQAWQNLFRIRKSWASGLLNGCDTRARQAQKYQDEQAVIERSLSVAVASLQQHIKSAEQKYATAESWSEEVLQDQENHINNWEANLDSLKSIPAKSDFTRFLPTPQSSSRRLSQVDNITTLQGFVDAPSVQKAASGAKSLMTDFAQRVVKMREDLDTAKKESEELLRAVDQFGGNSSASNTSEPAQLLDEIEIVFKKMTSDLEHVQQLPRVSQSVSQASKMALLHTRNYIPTLSGYCHEMNDLVLRTCELRNNAASLAQEHMRTLSSIESGLAEVYQDIKGLELPQDEQQAFTSLGMVSRLPAVYGALLVESVRRREWVAKMRRDTATLQEEVATYQDEEVKRRKRWASSVEDVVKPEALRSNVLGIDLTLQNEGGSWPMVTRDELQDYLNVLLEAYGQCAVTAEMDRAIKDLDMPTRKQIKHAKAFKNGSMHEAAFGDTSLLLRGDEQHKALREMNSRLEEELKGQKSRVRKLEDLLHRSSHIGRAGSGDMFTPQSSSTRDRVLTSPIVATPQPSEELSRASSVKHQRQTSAQVVEEKKLARRVVDLEAELQAAKDEASSRKNSDAEAQKQVEEAVSTKKDLMQNMEAQQREFATERRSLEKDLAEAKERVEELEAELERLIGSRDDERTGLDTRMAAFQEEIARLKEDASGHAARAATEQDARAAMERKLELTENARSQAEMKVQRVQAEQEAKQEAEAEQLQQLATAHAHLTEDGEVPSGLAALSAALEELSRKSSAHAKDLEEAVAFAKSENESLWASNERQKNELAAAAERQAEVEDQARQTQERLSAEEAMTQSLKEQLQQEQEQLRMLRSKFAEGETGSEVLRQRVADEEARAGKLSHDLAEANSHINSLDVEIMRLQKKHKAYHDTAEASSERLQKKAEHAKDVSFRLYSQNTKLIRLLERMGFAVSYQDENMILERASRMGASTSMLEPQLNRTVSLTSPSPTRTQSYNEDTDLSVLRWPDALSAEDETAQFDAYIQQISRFNLDTFSEAVIKRMRDFEYTAKKYNKEAKESIKRADAYKERSLKLKTEAHTKIAVKDFKEGDLALFLPTRGQAKGAWAAFNVGCPHYFLNEKEGMRLGNRDFIVARINKIEQRVVDLSKTPAPPVDDDVSEAGTSFQDDNPFDLSDGLTWWLVHATEERGAGGAPTTPGLGKSTVSTANVDVKGSIRVKRSSKGEDATKHLNKSLDSRRSSSNSKKSVAGAVVSTLATASGSPTVGTFAEANASRQRSESQASARPLPAPATGQTSGLGISTEANVQPQNDQVRSEQMLGP